MTDIEYTNIHQELSVLIDHQRQIILEEKINDFASGIQKLILNIQSRHQNVVNIRPWKELQNYVKEMNGKINTFALHSMDPDIVFTHKKTKRSIEKGLVVISFNIIMVKTETYTIYVFISIPDESFKGVEFSNGQLVQQIAMNNANTTMFFMDDTIEVSTGIYENVFTKPVDACISNLLKMEQFQNIYQNCNVKNETLLHDEIFALKKDAAIIIKFNLDNKETQIDCDDETEHSWTGAAIIFLSRLQVGEQ